jgi:hypothetical protein
MRWSNFTPQKDVWYSFMLEAESIEKFIDLIRNRTRDLPA